MIEQPFKGRAEITENPGETTITIPVRKSWFIIIFMSFWLCCWLFGMTAAGFGITTNSGDFHSNNGPVIPVIVGFGIFFLVIGLFVFSALYWMIAGKEIITISNGILTIRKKGSVFSRPKMYDLKEVKGLTAREEIWPFNYGNYFGSRSRFMGMYRNTGSIKFDYGLQTIYCASGIDEAEAKYIIAQLVQKRILREENVTAAKS